MSDIEKPTLLIIDGHSLAFRAFYALPVDSFQNREGQHTNAIHGFVAMLINLLKAEKPTHLAVAFDISRFSFRTREYPEYKGTRGETPSEFIGQIPLLEQVLKAMGIPTISKEDYEADDILATLATQGARDGYHVFVVSGDRDAIQMINDDVTLLYPNARGVSELKRYDRDTVFERYGIEPHQYPDVAALVGESSDNLIGIDKVGEKTAVKWINLYGSLDGVLEHAHEIKGVVGEKLREQSDRAIRNRKLNHLLTDVALPFGPNDLLRQPIDEAAVREIFDKLQFKTLLERVLTLAASDSGAGSDQTGSDQTGSGQSAELPVAEVLDSGAPPVRTLVDEELAKWLDTQSERGTAPLAVRVETVNGVVTGLGIASAVDSAYVPWEANRPDYVALEAWLISSAPKYLQGSKLQLKALRRSGLDLNGIAFDTSLAAWLLKPAGKTDDLASQVYDFLGETMPQGDPNQLVPDTEAAGVATEAWYVLRVAEYLAEKLEPGTRRVLDEIELPLVPVLATMELDGVAVSRPILSRLSGELGTLSADLASRAYAEIGHEVNLGSPKQLQQVLFDELKMPKTRANKTGFSTDAASLTDLQESAPHPFLDLLLQHRDATKLRQIIETLEKAVDENSRVHTTYDQTGTSTGRISSNDPNLQNIPVKTSVGRQIRSAFEKGEGYSTLLTADYSQIEMRIMAHLSGDEGLNT
ncbi:MAG: polymerase, partial [Microbacteriaceae bacterium]|nr:polymerase [Microbacteriaceae bacterium]